MEKEDKLIWIKRIVSKNNSFLVYVNDIEEPFIFTEEKLIANRIIKGNSFYESDWNKITSSLDEGILFEKLLKYICYLPRTKLEIIRYLEKLNASSLEIKNIVNKLVENNFINDERYAAFFIEEQMRKQKGPNAVKHVLLSKGIEENVINDILCNYDEEYLYNNALDMGNKTLKTVIGLPLQKQKESVYSRLIRMGYDSSIIYSVLSILNYSEIDLDKLEKEYLKLKDKLVDETKIIQKLLTKGYDYNDIIHVINKL